MIQWPQIATAKEILSREEGTIHKDWGGRLPVALVYPNTYYVGMSSLGLQTVYGLFNAHPDVVCERVFWAKGNDVPISLESQRPLVDFAVVAFSLSYELDYFHMVDLLRRAGIPLRTEERAGDGWPLLIAGGPAVTANPEPLALILDALAIGEGEVLVPGLVETLRSTAGQGWRHQLEALHTLPGWYVPLLHDGSSPVRKQWVRDLDAYPTTSLVLTPDTEFGDMYLIEMSRGCIRGCRFCLAGFCYRPQRERSPAVLLAQAAQGLRWRERIGLVGAAVSDYTRIAELVAGLREMGARLSVSSLRVDPLPEVLLAALAESGTHTLTVAPEAGTQRLREAIHKAISAEQILLAAEQAAAHGFTHLKLYFMLGLPGETDADVQAIADLVLAVKKRFPRRLTVNLTPFVPKAHTPFQWVAMAGEKTLRQRIRRVTRALRPSGVVVRAESPAWARVQGVLARGDQRVGEVLLSLREPTLAGWRQALREARVDADDYLGAWPLDASLPWQVVDVGVSPRLLRRELERAGGALHKKCVAG